MNKIPAIKRGTYTNNRAKLEHNFPTFQPKSAEAQLSVWVSLKDYPEQLSCCVGYV